MPLSEFITHPIAAELLHNGEAMQVLGLTNYSHWEHADALRECVSKDEGMLKVGWGGGV